MGCKLWAFYEMLITLVRTLPMLTLASKPLPPRQCCPSRIRDERRSVGIFCFYVAFSNKSTCVHAHKCTKKTISYPTLTENENIGWENLQFYFSEIVEYRSIGNSIQLYFYYLAIFCINAIFGIGFRELYFSELK